MDFASSYVFLGEGVEEVLDDDLQDTTTWVAFEHALGEEAEEEGKRHGAASASASASASGQAQQRKRGKLAAVRAQRAAKAKAKAKARSAHKRSIDTNVVKVALGTLADDPTLHTGDMVRCAECSAVFNHGSIISNSIWTCEMCGASQPVQLLEQERPTSESVDYLIKPAPAVEASDDDSCVVFCVDVSGSMCVTSKIEGRVALKGAKPNRNAELRSFSDGSDQYLPQESRNTTYVSRLQAMQGAVAQQLEAMQAESPKRQVGLVTFASDVHVYGDGTRPAQVVAGDRLDSEEQIRELAAGIRTATMSTSIGDAKPALEKALFDLEEGGQTALGPALLLSVAMAAQKPGSPRVVILTDGVANVGVGALDTKGAAETSQFYEDVAALALEAGVTVSVISIEGPSCRLENLGVVADRTGGDVERVDPLKLADNFEAMLQEPVIATNVQVKMMLHRVFRFRDERQEAAASVTRQVGSVVKDSELLFEFGVRSAEMAAAVAARAVSKTGAGDGGAEAQAEAEFPFQVSIRYTRPDGMQCERVLTRYRKATRDQELAEASMDVAICSANAAQQAARQAQEGDYEAARVTAHGWKNYMARVCTAPFQAAQPAAQQQHQQHQLRNYCTQMAELDTGLHGAQATEQLARATLSKSKSARSSRRTDAEARNIFKFKKSNSKAFK